MLDRPANVQRGADGRQGQPTVQQPVSGKEVVSQQRRLGAAGSRILCPACAHPLSEAASLEGIDSLHKTPGRFRVHLCSRCVSGRTTPLVSSDELGELYPSTYASHGLPRNRAVKLAATLLNRLRYWWALRSGGLEVLGRAPPGRLLDVGSGRGDLGVALARRGWRVTGLEPSQEACAEARSRGVSSEHGTLTTRGDGLPSAGYDAVVFQHSLEHVVEPWEDLAVVRGLLRGGGRLIVSAPNFACWQRRHFGSCWFHLELPRHRAHFSPQGLHILLRRSGFVGITIRTSSCAEGLPRSVHYRLLGERRLARGPGRLATTAVSLVLFPLTAALNALTGGGDVMTAVAVKPTEQRGTGDATSVESHFVVPTSLGQAP